MSTPYITTGQTGPRKHWNPARPSKVGFSKSYNDSATLYARMTVDAHKELGTVRDRWEPTLDVGDLLSAPYIGNGEQELAWLFALESEADPRIDESERLVENVKEGLDKIMEDARPIAARSSARLIPYPGRGSRPGPQQDDRGGRGRRASTYYRRVPRLLRRLATWARGSRRRTSTSNPDDRPSPCSSPGRTVRVVLRVSVVVVIIIGQTILVRHAAKDHNHAREANANGNRHPAEASRIQRNRTRTHRRDRRRRHQRDDPARLVPGRRGPPGDRGDGVRRGRHRPAAAHPQLPGHGAGRVPGRAEARAWSPSWTKTWNGTRRTIRYGRRDSPSPQRSPRRLRAGSFWTSAVSPRKRLTRSTSST